MRRFPPNSLSCLALALALLLAGCNTSVKPEGSDEGGMTHIANQLRAQGDDAGAADFYQRALAHDPNDVAARKALAEILEVHGDNQNAEKEYSEGLKLNPQNAEFLRARGRVLIKEGRAVDAKDDYQRALQIDSGDVKALNGLGISLDYLGQHDAAQRTYREALDDDQNNATTLNNLAHSYVLTGAYEDAIKTLEPHLKDKDATPALRQNLAEAYGLAGMDADAERVARMDLPAAQVQHNLAYYRSQRAKLSITPRYYADLGDYATDDMARAHAENLKDRFASQTDGLVISTVSQVQGIGGTPRFSVHVTGFASPDKIYAFCDMLKKDDIPCQMQKGM